MNITILDKIQSIANTGYWEYTFETDVLFWSDQVFKIFDFSKKDFQGKLACFIKFIHPEDREIVVNAYNLSLENNTNYEVEHRIITESGEVKYLLERCENYFDSKGKPIKSIGIVQDITLMFLQEKKYKEKSEEYKIIFDNLIDVFFKTDKEGFIVEITPSVFELIGYYPEELLGKKFIEVFVVDHEKRNEVISILAEKGSIRNYELELTLKNEKKKTVSINAKPLLGTNKEYLGAFGIARDISNLIFKRNQLIESNEKLNVSFNHLNKALHNVNRLNLLNKEQKDKYIDLFQNINDGFAILNKDGYVIEANSKFLEIMDLSHNEMRNNSISEFVHILDKEKFKKYIDILRTKGSYSGYRGRILCKNKKIKWLEINASAIYSDKVEFIGSRYVIRDVTESVNQEEKLKTYIDDIDSLLLALPDLIIRIDEKNFVNYVQCNDENNLFTSISNIENKNITNFLDAKKSEAVLKLIDESKNDREIKIFNFSVFKNENYQWFEARIFAYSVSQIICIIRNITQKIVAEKNLVNQYKKTELLHKNQEKIKIAAMIEAQDTERERFSREVHDSLGQLLTASKIHLDIHLKATKINKSNNIDLLKSREILEMAQEESKKISFNMLPSVLTDFGLRSAISKMVALTNDSNALQESKFSSNLDSKRFSKEVEYNFYRIFQESYNNALKYSKASVIFIRLYYLEGELIYEIEDNGIGFKFNHKYLLKEKQNNEFLGNGLININERVKHLNAKLLIETKAKKGTLIRVFNKI